MKTKRRRISCTKLIVNKNNKKKKKQKKKQTNKNKQTKNKQTKNKQTKKTNKAYFGLSKFELMKANESNYAVKLAPINPNSVQTTCDPLQYPNTVHFKGIQD